MKILIRPDVIRRLAATRSETLGQIALASGINPSHFYQVLAREYTLSAQRRKALLSTLGAQFGDLFEIVEEGGDE